MTGSRFVRTIAFAAILVLASLTCALCVRAADPPAATTAPSPAAAMSAEGASRTLAELAKELPAACQASRTVLLGSRDPDANTCVRPFAPGELDKGLPRVAPGDPNGGPGKRILQLLYWDHDANSPPKDYRWHRETLEPFLRRLRDDSNAARLQVQPLAARSRQLAEWLRKQPAWPAGFRSPGAIAPAASTRTAAPATRADNWPLACLAALNEAVGAKDLIATRLWAYELSAATFALEDLHRWVEFLAENHLANLRFQELCKGLFEEVEDEFNGPGQEPYVPRMCISRFPGGSLGVSMINNHIEIERQGEGFFRNPSAWARAVKESNVVAAGGALWMPPDLRGSFGKWRSALSEHNRTVLDRAAGSPLERSFLANMLFRCQAAGVVEQAGEVLRRFNARYPRADMWQLMDVLPYRAGLGMSGIEWGDRFDPRLMESARKITARDPHDALRAAREVQYKVYGGGGNYQGLVLTLRKALDTGRMDCIRATDMIAAVHRNAGFPGFLAVRWCRGTSGHSVAAAERFADGNRSVLIVDGLFPPGQAVGVWPEAYFQRHSRGGVYAVELYGRAIDGFVLLEAYVIRGPHAGTLIKVPVPYLPARTESSTKKVFPAAER